MRQNCNSCTNRRCLSLAAAAQQQARAKMSHPPGNETSPYIPIVSLHNSRSYSIKSLNQIHADDADRSTANAVMSATRKSDSLHVVFGDSTSSDLPYVWLRDNCQCSQCFSEGALGRKLLMQDLDLDVKPALISVSLLFFH